MEVLSMLLQMSLLFFGVGVFRSIQPQKDRSLDGVVCASLVLGVLFYIVTLLCGAIFARCPFKTPLTEYLLRFGVFTFLKPAQIVIYIVYVLPGVLLSPSSDDPASSSETSPAQLDTPQIQPKSRQGTPRVYTEGHAVSRVFRSSSWKTLFARLRDDRRFMDRHMIDEAKVGVYFWAILREGGTIDVNAAKDSILQMDKKAAKHVIHLEGVVHDWHSRAEHFSMNDSFESLKTLGDVVFYGLSDDRSAPHFDFSPCHPSKITQAIRIVWGTADATGTKALHLAGPELRPITVAAYISAELDAALDANPWNHWGSVSPQDRDSENLEEKSSLNHPLLNPSPHLQNDLTCWLEKAPMMELNTLVETFALIACIVVPRGNVRLQRFHVSAYGVMLRRLPWQKQFLKALEVLNSSNLEPQFGRLLLRALRVLRIHISLTIPIIPINNTEIKAAKPTNHENVILSALQTPHILSWLLSVISQRILQGVDVDIIQVYLEFLDLILGIHCVLPLTDDNKSSSAISVSPLVIEHSSLIPTLINLIDNAPTLRPCILSILVKGLPMFFPNVPNGSELLKSLEQLRVGIIASKKWNELVDQQEVTNFTHWDTAKKHLVSLKQQLETSFPTNDLLV